LRYVIIVGCLLSLIWTLNAFGQVFLLTGGGPGGATRLFSILAYEFAIGGLRYSAGVAVAMSVVPALLLLIIILGRYMQGDPDASNERGTALAQLGALLSWPFAIVLKGLLLVMTAVGDAVDL